MKVTLLQKNNRTFFYDWIGFFILSGVLLISVIWPPFSKEYFSLCLIKNIIGVDCPGCGMGRAFLFLGHGQISNAFHMNPVSLLAFPMILFFWINSILSLTIKKEMKIPMNSIEKGVAIVLALCLVLGIWYYKF